MRVSFALLLSMLSLSGQPLSAQEVYDVDFIAETYVFQCRDADSLYDIMAGSLTDNPVKEVTMRADARRTRINDAGLPTCEFIVTESGEYMKTSGFRGVHLLQEMEVILKSGVVLNTGVYILYDVDGSPMYSAFSFPMIDGEFQLGYDTVVAIIGQPEF